MSVVRLARGRDVAALATLAGQRGWSLPARYALAGSNDRALWIAEQADGRVHRLTGCLGVEIVAQGAHGEESRGDCVAPESIVLPLRYGRVREFISPATAAGDECAAGLLRCAELWLSSRGVRELHVIAPPDPAEPEHSRYTWLGFTPLLYRLGRAVNTGGEPGQAVIRPAAADDLPALAALVQAEVELQASLAGWFRLAPNIDWPSYVAERLRCPSVCILVAEQVGKLVGYAEFSMGRRSSSAPLRRLRRSAQPSRYGIVEDVFVMPGVRGQGIAAQLVEQGCAWLRSCGVQDAAAGVWASNTASLSFFVCRLGFTVASVQLHRNFAVASGSEPYGE